MRYFTCVLDPEGRGIPDRVHREYEDLPRTRGMAFRWREADGMAVLVAWDAPFDDPLPATSEGGGWTAVGEVRLDNRRDLERWAQHDGAGASDLELVRRVIALHGTSYVPAILGDFAFVAWQRSTRSALAACDPFAVRRLYYAERDGLIALSSRAEALATREAYELRYLTERVALSLPSHDLTAYSGVHRVPRASQLLIAPGGRLATRRYWRASDYAADPSVAIKMDLAAEVCRDLLSESIRLRMGSDGETWAQLSGGLDSSSVVSCAQWLARQGKLAGGLAGTVSFVDYHGTGTDEREYSDAVADRWRVLNATIVDPPTWHDPSCAIPHLDQPTGDLQVYPRDRRLCAIVRAAGGRILLTGMGGDQLFSGTMLFFADWVARGKISSAIREMARRSAMGRVSFWELSYRNAFLPLLPRAMHALLVQDQDEIPAIPWLNASSLRRFDLARHRSTTKVAYGGPLKHKYEHAVASMIDSLEDHYQGGVIADSLDVRHPLLYRPLVEFALRLPPEMRVQPHAH